MRITRIDIEGKTGRYATISRSRGSSRIDISTLTPNATYKINIPADDPDRQWAAAVNLQKELDGYEGTNSMIHDYYNVIRRFAD